MQIEEATSVIARPARTLVRLAETETEIRAAQQLRWQVFVEEQGARISTITPGYDIDDLDRYCHHLIAVDPRTSGVVGTYRLLTAEAARRAGGYYSEREFELSSLLQPGQRLLELGRSCVLPQYRTGATIAMLWSALADFAIASRHDALIGCASIGLSPDAEAGAALARRLSREHAAPLPLRAVPRIALPTHEGVDSAHAVIPPLIKGYLRSGAVVCGEPYWDRDFNCADLLIHLSLDRIAGRYARKFLPALARGLAVAT